MPAVDHGDLSPRERDVLRAVTEQRSNAEIAARFVLSVRTVESHVASLLRKTGAGNRRELAQLGRALDRGDPAADGRAPLPDPPSTFVGRDAERAALTAALATHRLVTAVGPGGVGKTRIALQVSRVAERFADGTVFVDLVPVADPSRAAAAVAAAAGVAAEQAATPEEALTAWLRSRELLLVVDNCEHVADAVAPLIERLLAACPRLTVLATSRARLLVPHERVVPVPGLSVDEVTGGGDAVELFRQRAEAQGAPLSPQDARRVAAVCARLDGMALAIELAAARLPSIGLDGLEAALTRSLDLLAGGRRTDERHRSLRATIEWSVALLGPAERDLLADLAVFAAPFDAASAAALGGLPVPSAQARLGALADSSLLSPDRGAAIMRFRMLEAVRQHGLERLEGAGRLEQVRGRHLELCLAACRPGADFDTVAPEARAALAAAGTAHRPAAHRLAVALAELAFAAGAPAEAQLWFERAAELAPDPASEVDALRDAAGAAEARNVGLDALRLHRQAATTAEANGDPSTAAIALARVGVLVARAPGIMARAVPVREGVAALDAAASLAGTDPLAAAHVQTARSLFDFVNEEDAARAEAASRNAIAAAATAGDPLLENVALDGLTSVLLVQHDIAGALAASLRREALLATVPMTARAGLEFADTFSMAGECAMAAGDLPLARRFGELVRTLPAYGREPHLATSRTVTFGFLAGEVGLVTALGPAFVDGWDRAGRPRAGNLLIGSQAIAAAFAMAGDQAESERWQRLGEAIRAPHLPMDEYLAATTMHAIALVQAGRAAEAAARLTADPDEIRSWQNAMWRPWYAAVRAEAAVVAGARNASDAVDAAVRHSRENPVAALLVERAGALARGEGDLPALAARLEAAGAHYQAARTLVLAGGDAARRGIATLVALGIRH